MSTKRTTGTKSRSRTSNIDWLPSQPYSRCGAVLPMVRSPADYLKQSIYCNKSSPARTRRSTTPMVRLVGSLSPSNSTTQISLPDSRADEQLPYQLE
eukprot:6484994-Amphidinium_carterae.2